MKVLVATSKPFAKVAVDGIREVIEGAGYELVLLEKYTEKSALLSAVADVDAIIIRSDIIDAEVFDAAKQLKIVVRAGAGYDNVDLEAASAAKVVVMNTPGQNANAVAEHSQCQVPVMITLQVDDHHADEVAQFVLNCVFWLLNPVLSPQAHLKGECTMRVQNRIFPL